MFWINPGSRSLQNNCCIATYFPSHKSFKLDKQDMLNTSGEVKKNSKAMFSYGVLDTDAPGSADQQGFTYINSEQILDAA